MLEKPKRQKQLNNQDRQLPATIQELVNRYDLENKNIYKFLDYLVDNINSNKNTVIDNLESESATDALSANQGKILNEKFSKQIITAKGETGTDTLASTTGTKVELVTAVRVGNKLTLENGGIKIGAGVKTIGITASTVYTSSTFGNHSIEIYKNNINTENRLARAMFNTSETTLVQTTLNCSYQITDNIKEGDIIYLYVASSQSKRVSNPSTYLTIEVVE